MVLTSSTVIIIISWCVKYNIHNDNNIIFGTSSPCRPYEVLDAVGPYSRWKIIDAQVLKSWCQLEAIRLVGDHTLVNYDYGLTCGIWVRVGVSYSKVFYGY